MRMDKDALREEQQALSRILQAFLTYRGEAVKEPARWEHNYRKLSDEHKALLPHYLTKCEAARSGVRANQAFLTAVVSAFQEPGLAGGAVEELRARLSRGMQTSAEDADKVRYVLKNAMRDWSGEGAAERAQSYGRICTEIQERLPASTSDRPRILVPGCGLGRLPFDLSRLGYICEGNEYNYFMLLASAFILNHTDHKGQWTIHPFLHSSCNHRSDEDQVRGIAIPDVDVRESGANQGVMTMSAGDFEDVYSKPEYRGAYDCVVSCFFLDCAHNIIAFIDIIHQILKAGGLWVNLGPLLYHWADAHTYLPSEELSIELSLESVEAIMRQRGFATLQRSTVPAAFNSNVRSMLNNSYNAAFWTVQKQEAE